MSKWPRLRLTKYVDDLTISHRGMNESYGREFDHGGAELVGWLENGLDFHVSKDEKGVVLVSCADHGNEGARHEGRLARSHPGDRRVWSGRREAAQDGICAADQNQEEDAQGSVLQEVRSDDK